MPGSETPWPCPRFTRTKIAATSSAATPWKAQAQLLLSRRLDRLARCGVSGSAGTTGPKLLYQAIGAGNLRAFVDGQDTSHGGISN